MRVGQVGRFTAVDAVRYPRGSRVIIRTGRGLEIGEVLAPPDDEPDPVRGDGSVLRGMTVEDQLLEARCKRNRQAALEACAARLAERNLPAVLMDVEHLFDGHSLVFYFLGEVSQEVSNLTAELAEVYEAQVQIRKFTEAVTTGCGPGCGTDEATGGGCKTCTTGCAISAHCAAHA